MGEWAVEVAAMFCKRCNRWRVPRPMSVVCGTCAYDMEQGWPSDDDKAAPDNSKGGE